MLYLNGRNRYCKCIVNRLSQFAGVILIYFKSSFGCLSQFNMSTYTVTCQSSLYLVDSVSYTTDHRTDSSAQPTTHSVTPADQMSTLNPEKVSSPLAISGG